MSSKNYATTSGSIAQTSAGQTIPANMGVVVTDVQLVSNGTIAATLQVYAGNSASAPMIANLAVSASTTSPTFMPFNIPVSAPNGVFTVCTGTGASFIIHYAPGSA